MILTNDNAERREHLSIQEILTPFILSSNIRIPKRKPNLNPRGIVHCDALNQRQNLRRHILRVQNPAQEWLVGGRVGRFYDLGQS